MPASVGAGSRRGDCGSLLVHRITNVKDGGGELTEDDPAAEVAVNLILNGRQTTIEAPAHWTLADVLRERAGLTGLHLGCEHGVCGACTVLLDGDPVRSCIVLAVQVDGHAVVTIEGLGSGEELHPVQRAFIAQHALQCGYCTPGFIILIASVLDREPHASPERLRQLLSSNICRCTGYKPIMAAALAAQRELNTQ